MRDQAAVLEDGEDFFGEGGEVIFVTFVIHYSFLEVDRDRGAFIHCVDPFLKPDHRKAVVDRVAKEDAREGFGPAFPRLVDKCFVRDYYMFANREQEDIANK